MSLDAVPRQRAYVGLGGNLGDVRACLQSALTAIGHLPGTRVVAVSSLYRSRPVDADGPDYLNAVAALESALGPHELLHALLGLETAHDRTRPYHHAPRTLDLDLLWYGGCQRCTSSLSLPHPRMFGRAFVLLPLAEVLQGLPDGGESGLVLPDAAERERLAQAQGIERVGPCFP